MADSEHNGSPVNNLKVEVRAGLFRKETSPRNRKESHGRGDDIDVNTPIGEFRGPSIFERAKEEFEALVDTIHPKKEYDSSYMISPPKKGSCEYTSPPKKDGGFRASIGKRLEKISSTKTHNHQD